MIAVTAACANEPQKSDQPKSLADYNKTLQELNADRPCDVGAIDSLSIAECLQATEAKILVGEQVREELEKLPVSEDDVEQTLYFADLLDDADSKWQKLDCKDTYSAGNLRCKLAAFDVEVAFRGLTEGIDRITR